MTNRRLGVLALLLGAVLAVAAGGARLAGLRVNTTPSVPVGLWVLSANAPLGPGVVVSVCPDNRPAFAMARARGYLSRGSCAGGDQPLFKPVVALSGDRVTVSAEGLAVNGVPVPNSRAAPVDALGRALPVFSFGTYTVAPGRVWVVSSLHPASFDSRYFGPLPVDRIEGVLRPLWVKR